jgi:hypothetical protein
LFKWRHYDVVDADGDEAFGTRKVVEQFAAASDDEGFALMDV